MNNINWFPGHMTKTIRNLKEIIKIIDVVFEIIDARIPKSSSNPIINELSKHKKKIIIINKIDLADDKITKLWKEFLLKNNDEIILVNSKHDKLNTILIKSVKNVLSEKIKKYAKKGLINYQIKIAILGIPNVGKSTIINNISKGLKKVKTGNKPGITRGHQWIDIESNIKLLDTPGILWPKFDNEIEAKNLAITGSIKSEILNKNEIVNYGIEYLLKNYFNLFKIKYFNNLDDSYIKNIKNINEYIEILQKKYNINNDKIINKLFYDFINSKIGKISWEKPYDNNLEF